MSTPQDPFAAPDPDQPPATQPEQDEQPPAYGQPQGYGQPTPYGQAPSGSTPDGTQAPRNGLGTAALVLGILAVLGSITIVLGIVLGALALIFGLIGRGRAKRHEATNGSSATAGAALGAVGLLISLVVIAVGVSFFNSDSGQKLRDCLTNAGNDTAAQRQCQIQFQKDFVG